MILLNTDVLSLFHAGNETVVDRITKVDADIDAKVAFVFDEPCERKNLKKIGLADLLIASGSLDAEALLDEVLPSLEQISPNLAREHATQCMQLAKTLSESEATEADAVEVMLEILNRLQPQDDSPIDEVTELSQYLQAKLKTFVDQQLRNDLRMKRLVKSKSSASTRRD